MKYDFDAVPENLKKYIDPSLDRDTMLMAAQGLVPIPPEDMALVLFYLTSDDDQQIVKESEKSLFTIPDNAIERVLSNSSSPPELLDYFARKSENDNHIEKIILNNSSSSSSSGCPSTSFSSINSSGISISSRKETSTSATFISASCSCSCISESS